MPNRLASETSPYLLQHADNPVDWYPWCAEAFERAKRENRPILLSIGYAACHWCHVMAHESFDDAATASAMNERFVNIKVDREERPDVDAIYMQAVQAMTGHGGWPMTVFLTPDGVPFYGGTYFPREDRHGMPSFVKVLGAVSDAYRNKPETVERTVASVREMYAHAAQATRGNAPLGATLLDNAYEALASHYDERNGGFSNAPKFPQTMSLDFLLRHWARRGVEHALAMVRGSFLKMARGGIYDQIGGGFARYSVDEVWLVPHFEKMLYDNALLVRLGTHLWQAVHDDEVRRIVEETIAWAASEMRGTSGGFGSSYDADSEGHEGTFYVWTAEEFNRALGDDAAVMRAYWGVSDGGNFEGSNILSVATDTRAVARRFNLSEDALAGIVARARRVLYDLRRRRAWPGRDDKVLASWNGLMIRGLADAARAFDRDDYRRLAVEGAEFLFAQLTAGSRVFRSFKDGRARIAGYLEDHAALGLAALAVYEITFDEAWLARARALADAVVRWFWDDDAGAFFDTASDQDPLITRPREVTDNAIPSGTSLAIELLLRIAELYDDATARGRATRVLESLAPAIARYPMAFGHLLGCVDMVVNGAVEVAIAGERGSADFTALARTMGDEYVPSLVLAGGRSEEIALLRDRPMCGGKATAYVCRNHACDEPVTEPERLREQLGRMRRASMRRSG